MNASTQRTLGAHSRLRKLAGLTTALAVGLGLGLVATAPAKALAPPAVNANWLDYYFNNKAIGGDSAGDAPNLEGGKGFHRTNLASGGLEAGGLRFGQDSAHPTDPSLTYRIASDTPGPALDNVEARGQTINTSAALGSAAASAATKISFVWTAHNANDLTPQNVSLHYQGESVPATLTLQPADWCTGTPNPGGNVAVAARKARYGDSVDCTIFASPVFTLAAGKKLDSITLPNEERVHIFAVASDANTANATSTVSGSITLPAGLQVGQTVAPTITWSGTAPDNVTGRWYLDGSPLDAVNSSAQVVPTAWAGRTLAFAVVAHVAGYRPISLASSDVVVQPGAVQVVTAPTVAGLARVGDTLVLSDGVYRTPSENPTLVATTIEWLADGAPIAGATEPIFVPTTAQLGKAIAARVTITKVGFATQTLTTPATTAVLAADVDPFPNPGGGNPPAAPPASVAVRAAFSVSGTARVGATVRATAGTYTPASARVTYQWLRGTRAIPGATKPTYQPVAADANTVLSVQVVATATGLQPVTQLRTVGRVAVGTIRVAKPTIRQGARKVTAKTRVKVGATLRARTATAKPAGSRAAVRYQWLANGKALPGKAAKRATFKATRKHVGKRLSVRVTYQAKGYAAKNVTSARTGKVVR